MIKLRNLFGRDHYRDGAWLRDDIVLSASLVLLFLALAASVATTLVVL